MLTLSAPRSLAVAILVLPDSVPTIHPKHD